MSTLKKTTKITIPVIQKKKQNSEKIAALTAYDFLMAEMLDESGIDIILVGDSAGMVISGFESTLPVTVEMMMHHARAVRKEGGAEAVKIEGGSTVTDIVSRLVDIGIPVMGHLGLTPQSINIFGNYRVVGKKKEIADKLKEDALSLEKSGAFSIVLEMIPAKLAAEISDELKIPTIGIGSGKDCDGQILVSHDMLGLYDKFKPRFVRRYAHLSNEMKKAFINYIGDVKSGKYTSDNESY